MSGTVEAGPEALNVERLHAALRQAVGDMDDRLASGAYVVRSDVWHRVRGSDRRCEICLAGGTFARMGIGAERGASATEAAGGDEQVLRMLLALNALRRGMVVRAAVLVHGLLRDGAAARAHEVEEWHAGRAWRYAALRGATLAQSRSWRRREASTSRSRIGWRRPSCRAMRREPMQRRTPGRPAAGAVGRRGNPRDRERGAGGGGPRQSEERGRAAGAGGAGAGRVSRARGRTRRPRRRQTGGRGRRNEPRRGAAPTGIEGSTSEGRGRTKVG